MSKLNEALTFMGINCGRWIILYGIKCNSNSMQGALKGMILSALLTGEKTSNSIFDDVVSNEYEYDIPGGDKQKFTYDGTLNNLRVDILYLRTHKYIRIVNKEIPYIYALTQLGKQGAVRPFLYLEYRQKAIDKAVKSRAEELKTEFEDRENGIKNSVKARVAELETQFESRVKNEAENRIEAEIESPTTLYMKIEKISGMRSWRKPHSL